MPAITPPYRRRVVNAAAILQRAAFLTFALYLILLIGTGSVARAGGPMTWLPLWQLPAAGNKWEIVGVVALLPPLSILCWILARAGAGTLRLLHWGWPRITWPLATLGLLGLLSILRSCPGDICNPIALLRLLLLLAHLFWIYFYLVNEKPDLFWIVIVVILMQSVVALGQFIWQRDLGLSFLGESPLDPQVGGVSVVMRGSERWLRAYGLAIHPNVLAGTLVTMLLSLVALVRRKTPARRLMFSLAFSLGFAALLATLARWAIACLLLGLLINAIPWLRTGLKRHRWANPPLGSGTLSALLIITLLFIVGYGDAAAGRAAGLDTTIESRSLWERNRDMRIGLSLLVAHPALGVGLGEYIPAAREYNDYAGLVHNVPLLLAAELGIAGLLIWLWLVVAPLTRHGVLTRFAPQTGLWLSFWLLGLLYPTPHPLYELRGALLTALVAGIMAYSGFEREQ